ncbi:MAG: hypothetical protein ACK4FL_02375, partial [Microgenomates group bacterium]
MLNLYLFGLKKILTIAKKVFLVVVVYFVIISLFAYFINTDKPKLGNDPIKKNRAEIYQIINDKKLNSTNEGKIAITIYRAMLCGMIGEACTDNPDDGDKNFSKSVFGFVSNLIILPYANPPASGVYWVYNGLQNAGFIPKTYAAEGIGFAALKPFMGIWKVFRDISYMLLVLVLIAIGFMIMFRAKLNPQTVISVENALPKIVIALLLITFSFPIAGFLIDLMYVIILIAISILSSTNIGQLTPANKGELFQNYTINGFNKLLPLGFSLFDTSIGGGLLDILGNEVKAYLYTGVGSILTYLISSWLVQHPPVSLVPKILGLENAQGGIATVVVGVGKIFVGFLEFLLLVFIFAFLSQFALPFVVTLLVSLTIAFLMFRIFFLLLATYLRIVFYIIISPLLLLLEAVPGKNSFSTWFKNLFADILTFPLVIIILLIGHAVINQSTSQGVWTPPFLYSIQPTIFPVLIGLGLFLITPELIKAFKESLGAKGIGVEIGLGTFFGGVGAAWAGTQTGMGMLTSLSQLPFIGHQIRRHPLGQKIFGPLT